MQSSVARRARQCRAAGIHRDAQEGAVTAGWLTPIAVALAYLIGAIPFGLLVTRLLAGADVRTGGSGNIGATNVVRVAGKKLGALTLLLDALKGLLPVLGARALGIEGPWLGGVALAAVAGHCFPIYLGFKGGKGVATGLGVFAALAPLAAAIGAVCYAAIFALLRISSLGSMTLLASTLLATALIDPVWWLLATEAAIAALIVARHRDNLGRLVRGQEAKFK
ncbi:MAG: glycerol-3-phosphate 1-O-acyltransferase PlsY [Deltaproteobacteria bacterium]|nr:glycerol-3-phosphate 1-O-acyltransferase PlsY [Deltaproteobacteria bacterium]